MFGAWSECMGHRHGVGGEAWGTAGRVRNMFGNSPQIVGCRDVFRNNEALGRWPAFGRTTHSSRPLPGPYRPYRRRNHVPKFRESALALAAHPPPPPPSPEAPQLPTCSEHGPKLSQNFARPSLKITPLPTDSRPQIPAAKAIAPGWGKSGAKLTGGSTL